MALVLVGLDVSSQVRSVCKSLSALVASVWLLSRVKTRVVLKQPRTREGLRTDVTFEVADVCLKVHGKGGHADVELVADVASLGVVSGEGLVGLSVPRKVGSGGEELPTLWTFLLLGAALLLHRRPAPEHVDDELRVLHV